MKKNLLLLLLAPLGCLSAIYYQGTLELLHSDAEQARAEQADLDSLGLEGSRVFCRDMNWFVDRDVVTVFLPYADVAGLEQYVLGQHADGCCCGTTSASRCFASTRTCR
jgi:hypothetical protein